MLKVIFKYINLRPYFVLILPKPKEIIQLLEIKLRLLLELVYALIL